MKSDHPKKMISESRKIRKPLMEKKRRARINDSLEALKQILLESKTTLKESNGKKSGQRTAKLEKADILEMTVRYVQHLHNRLNQTVKEQEIKKGSSVRQADSSTERSIKMGVTLIPTKLNNGDIVFVMPSNLELTPQQQQQISVKINENVWRPW